jgi:DnaJ-class molecular chaperone
MQTLYETLELPKTAKPEQIKRAYRVLVKRFHPDLLPSGSNAQAEAEVRIRQVTAAYRVLSNPEKRSAYDAKVIKQRSPYNGEVKTGIL